MQLVEQHIIRSAHPGYKELDQASFASKNLYNASLYACRQQFFEDGSVPSYQELCHEFKDHDAYKALPAKVAQQVLKNVRANWNSYFEATAEYAINPGKFLAEPRIPGYKDKAKGRNVLTYTIQAIGKRLLRKGTIKPSGLKLTVPTLQDNVQQVRIVPKKTHYVLEVIYTKEPQFKPLNPEWVAGLDPGLNNLAVVASNKPGFVPVVVNGRPLKSLNQFYNKRKAFLQSKLPEDQFETRQIDLMSAKRTRRINNYLHRASRAIVDHLVSQSISRLIIGKNDLWKQEINLGRRNNQNFVNIPHARFIEMLQYKCELVGIDVTLQEESYTSKTSALDLEDPSKHEKYVGRRIKRGLFKSAMGKLINADVNGAYQIIRKALPAVFGPRDMGGLVVHPEPLRV